MQSKPAAERESARKACRRAERELDAEVDQIMSKWLEQLEQRQDLAAVLGSCDCIVSLQTTAKETVWRVRPKTAAPEEDATSQESVELDHDLHLVVDERLLEEVAEKAVGGKLFGEETWHKLGQLLPKLANKNLEVRDPEQVWAVSFAEHPVDIDFANDQVVATLHISSLTRGEQTMPPMNLSVTYGVVTPSPINGVPVLRRVGRPQATMAERADSLRLGLRQQIYRSMVRERVMPLLPEEVEIGRLPTVEGSDLHRTIDLKIGEGRLELLGDWSIGEI